MRRRQVSSPKVFKSPVERLETRVLFHSQATSIISDNRGEVLINVNAPLDPTTINGRSVQIHTTGADGFFGTADDVKLHARVRLTNAGRRITITTDQLPFNTTYSVKVSGSRAFSADGDRFDGEFNGPGQQSGNGTPGGDLLFVSRRNKSDFVTRMQTSLGAINVRMFLDQAPNTVSNFLDYVNGGIYDGTFFHRSAHLGDESPFVIQAGGFGVDPVNNTLKRLGQNPPVVNEPGVSNTRGTIAMAKIGGDPNSATNQFFFNERDNSGEPAFLDTQNGGFTVFGEITNAGGLAVMDSIGALPKKDLRSGNLSDPNNPTIAMDDTPVVNPNASANALNPQGDLVVIRRVALVNRIGPFIIGG